jgi:mannose-6-phosphate isomerase-like protein (cupin superfamily)
MTKAEFHISEGCFITEWSNTSDDPAASIARARVPPGVTTRWHRLKDIVERYAILEGSGRAYIGDAAPRNVQAGDVVRIPAGVRQRIANTGKGDLVFLAVCTPRFAQDAYEELEC